MRTTDPAEARTAILKAGGMRKSDMRVYVFEDCQPHGFNAGMVVVSRQPEGTATFSVDASELVMDNEPRIIRASKHEVKRLMAEAISKGDAFAAQKIGVCTYKVMTIHEPIH